MGLMRMLLKLVILGIGRSFNLQSPGRWVVLQSRFYRLIDIICHSLRAASRGAHCFHSSVKVKRGDRPVIYTMCMAIQALSGPRKSD